jgi:hypothetical protein
VLNVKELNDKILCEAYESAYSIHPRGNKMYHDVKATYWWYGMKRDVVENVALVTPIRKSSPSINDPLGCCNPRKYPSGSGKKLL